MRLTENAMKKKPIVIAFEGISAAGKGTQIDYLVSHLQELGLSVFVTHWNSDSDIGAIISRCKAEKRMTSYMWCLLHACEFRKRYEEEIVTALRNYDVVIFDRCIFTALTRDVVRGCEERYIRSLYSFAIRPDIVFYLTIDVDTAFCRRSKRFSSFPYYSSGLDLFPEYDACEAWKAYNQLILNRYNEVVTEDEVLVIDAKKDKYDVREEIWDKFQRIFLKVK